MTPKADSRRRTPDGDVVLVKPRDLGLLIRLRSTKEREAPRRDGRPGWTQREVAAAVGISHGHYAEIELGGKQPSYAVAKRIAAFHDLSVDALFEELPLEFGDPDA